ncbi:hypothetical protein TKK_0014495 [Trichogramma kaykai]
MELSKSMNKLRDASIWQEWKFLITMHLDDADLLGHCDGSKAKSDKAARKTIAMIVESKPLQMIMDCKSAYDMWNKLHAVYEMKSKESLSLIQKKFFDFKWDPAGSMSQRISDLEQLANKMKLQNREIPQSMLITRILCTLPAKYDHFHSAWDSTEAGKRTLENLTTRLMTEELRLDNRDNEESVSTALLSNLQVSKNHRTYEKKTNDFKGKVRRCYNCKSTEHIQHECSGCRICKSNKHLAHRCPNKNKRGDLERQDDPSEHKHIVLIGSTGTWYSDEDWVIDSRASDHTSPRREWFEDYQEYNEPRKVEIGNGVLLAVGEGNINIETVVRKKIVSGTMYNVLFLPNLCRNLLSIRTAAKKGIDFTVSNRGKNCILLKDGDVIAIGAESENLYLIKTKVIFPSKAFAANKIESLEIYP